MTKDDREEVEKMITNVISTPLAEINGKIEIILLHLSTIKDQTIKTNGRVNRHDEELKAVQLNNIDHVVHCPVVSRVKILEDSELSRKSIVAFTTKAIAITATVTAIIVTLVEFITK